MKKILWLMAILINLILWAGCQRDAEAPVVSITNPADSTAVSGTVNITVSAADNKGIERIDLFINDSLIASLAAEPYNYSWATDALTDSTYHRIAAKAYDAAENEGVSPTITVMVDNTIPCASILLWNFDQADQFYDAEALDTVDCTYGLEHALTDNGYTYAKVADLPVSLDSFDIIIATIGFRRTC